VVGRQARGESTTRRPRQSPVTECWVARRESLGARNAGSGRRPHREDRAGTPPPPAPNVARL